MEFKQTRQALYDFANSVIKQAKGNLARHKKNRFITGNSSGQLSNSLGYSMKGLDLQFYMAEYGVYQDEGVKGSKTTYDKSKNSRFSYTNKRPPSQPLADWAKAKNIRLRDEKGRFKKGNYKSIGYILAKNIFEKGLRASFFFTKPFEQNLDKLENNLADKFALDIEDLIQFTQ
mgnify:FL=1